MIWLAIAAVVIALAFVFINRPVRVALALTAAAHRARARKDWQAAARFCRQASDAAGKLKEPVKSKVDCQIDIQLATVLYRQGQMRKAEEMLQQGMFKARRFCGGAADMLVHGEMTWGDLCTDQGRYHEA